jgi:hypothetical protein
MGFGAGNLRHEIMPLRWPRPDEHTSIIGQNGSGKTRLAAYIVSTYDYTKRRGIIIDYKREPLFAPIRDIQQLGSFGGNPPWRVPRRNGLYIVQPDPDEQESVERLLFDIWKKGNTLLYIDEAHMLPENGHSAAFRAILTQGRSKRIQGIILTQRPVWVSPFVFSEAKFFAVFYLSARQDRNRVNEFVPANLDNDLDKYCCRWYSTGDRELYHLKPVPDAATIQSAIASHLPRRRW